MKCVAPVLTTCKSDHPSLISRTVIRKQTINKRQPISYITNYILLHLFLFFYNMFVNLLRGVAISFACSHIFCNSGMPSNVYLYIWWFYDIPSFSSFTALQTVTVLKIAELAYIFFICHILYITCIKEKSTSMHNYTESLHYLLWLLFVIIASFTRFYSKI